MAENQEQPKPREQRINVILDTSPQIKELNKIIEAKDEIIKSYLIKAKETFENETERKNVEANMDKKPTNYDPQNTASLLNEPSYKATHETTYHFDNESEILSLNPKFPSTEEAMNYLKKCASNPQSGDYRLANQLYGKLVSKALKQGGTYEFCGNMAKWERHGNEVVKANRTKTFKRVDD
jgi:hypothetical protein